MENTVGHRLTTDDSFAFNTLINVFEYLKFKDLLNCAQVCKTWLWVIKTDSLWKDISVYSCAEHVCTPVDMFGSNLRHLEIVDPYRLPPDRFSKLCSRLPMIKNIGLHTCDVYHLIILAQKASEKLERISAEVCYGHADWEFFDVFQKLTHLDITITHQMTRNEHYLFKSKKLRHLKFFMMRREGIKDNVVYLEFLESLCINMGLEYSFMHGLFQDRTIKHLKALTKLQINNMITKYHIMKNLQLLPKLKELILLQIMVPPPATIHSLMTQLGELSNLTRLTISLNRIASVHSVISVASENSGIFQGVITMQNKLKYFCWQIDESEVIRSDLYFHSRDVVPLMSYCIKGVNPSAAPDPVPEVMDIRLSKLEEVLHQRMPNTEVVLVKSDDLYRAEKNRLSCYECGKKTSAMFGHYKWRS
ncbi:uncharacterized protein [Euwallacea similis]|uniref:uncharacterized protein n=1 Tax=Euwallacea similis TaxID=1736056 RepID=UPI00344D0397